MDLKNKLRQMDPQSQKKKEAENEEKTTAQGQDLSDVELSKKLAGNLIQNEGGEYFLREVEYPLTRKHGEYCFKQLTSLGPPELKTIRGKNNLPKDLDHRDLLFLDTETTGLMGGTGTIPFLVGLGYFTDDSFLVQQYFMRDYDDETALLTDLNDIWDEFDLFVSFNGKSFDLPLIKTRFIMNRMKGREVDDHLDLLHSSRRVYKHLSSCSLENLEKEVLKIQRNNDLPGREVPTLYFKYLEQKKTELLAPIFKHNLIDIVSLVTLLIHLNKIYNKPEEGDLSAEELYNLGCCWENRKDLVKSIKFYEKSYQKVSNEKKSRYIKKKIAVDLSWQYKRADRWEEAVEIWEMMIENNLGGIFPFIELAKYYEHQDKNYKKAKQYTIEADKHLKENRPLFKKYSEKQKEIKYRLDRIKRKHKQMKLSESSK